MAQKTPKNKPEAASLILDDGTGRLSNALSKAIAYERTPSLFDEDYIKERDEELKNLLELKKGDTALCIDRRNKPVFLTSYQNRIIHALSYAISREIERSEDVKMKIQAPTNYNITIRRNVNITALTSLIFNSTRKRYKETIIREIYNLAHIRQVQILGSGDNQVKLTSPLILVGATLEDLSPEKRNNLDVMEIFFGTAFFYDLSTRYATITPKLFEVWGKSGRGTELFSVLLDSIFSVYWHYRQAANKAEEQTKHYYKTNKIARGELKEAIADARREAMTYELNISTIKQRVTTNYDSNPNMKRKFKQDLQNAINGFKELDLITDGIIQVGAKGQEKVTFILSETYNFTEKVDTSQTLLGIEENKPSAF